MMSLIRSQVVEMISALDAEARIAGRTLSAAVTENDSESAAPLRNYLIERGISDIIRSAGYDEKMRLKIMQLDPETYRALEAEKARIHKASLADRRTPKQIADDAEAERKEKARRKRVSDDFTSLMSDVNKAMAFYEKWKMPDGTLLGDASKEKLLSESKRELASAEGHSKNANFYSQLAAKLAPGECVRDRIDVSDAHRIRESIFTAL